MISFISFVFLYFCNFSCISIDRLRFLCYNKKRNNTFQFLKCIICYSSSIRQAKIIRTE
nr:MAG TPA: hypothetical protein [Caudoviricetes sp.]